MSLKSQLLCQTTNSASLTNNTGALHHHDHSKSYNNSSVKFCAAAISDNLENSHENANVSPHVKLKFLQNCSGSGLNLRSARQNMSVLKNVSAHSLRVVSHIPTCYQIRCNSRPGALQKPGRFVQGCWLLFILFIINDIHTVLIITSDLIIILPSTGYNYFHPVQFQTSQVE